MRPLHGLYRALSPPILTARHDERPVYITLPVAALPRPVRCFTGVGFAPGTRFAGDGGVCLVLNATTAGLRPS